MEKANITLSFEKDKLEALEFYAKKENSSVRKRLDEALLRLYGDTVPEPLREYLDAKAAPAARPRRPVKAKQDKHVAGEEAEVVQ